MDNKLSGIVGAIRREPELNWSVDQLAQMAGYSRSAFAARFLRLTGESPAAFVTDQRLDGEPNGDPVIPNGLSLCKIHHAAFDSKLLGIRPDLILHVRSDVLEEVDGWMLKGGIQAVHNQQLEIIPARKADQPDPIRLEERYQQFLAS